jgi:hypothetical protein
MAIDGREQLGAISEILKAHPHPDRNGVSPSEGREVTGSAHSSHEGNLHA